MSHRQAGSDCMRVQSMPSNSCSRRPSYHSTGTTSVLDPRLDQDQSVIQHDSDPPQDPNDILEWQGVQPITVFRTRNPEITRDDNFICSKWTPLYHGSLDGIDA